MIIDFHTHVFPDKIAQKTVSYLAEKAAIPPFSDGTAAGLLKRMEEATADIAVNLPVLTNPAQFESVNRFARELNLNFAKESRGILSFAGIHPACEQIERKMAWIREHGFLGVKIHPDYQETFIDDEAYVRILQAAKEYDLVVVTHAGIDAGYRNAPIRCTPERALRLIRRVGHKKLVLAHLGGSEMREQVLELLAGEDVYFDTAYLLSLLGKTRFQAFLNRHGEDRILFASDSPWSSIQRDADVIRSYSLPSETEEKIFSGNARRLLGL